MKSLTTNKKLMTLIAITIAASLAIPYALATDTQPPVPTIPSQCTTAVAAGWSTTPIIDAAMTVRNYEDPGVVGYWALDNFVESFVIWQNTGTTPNTFCALDQYSGTWTTFAGALSPQNGVSEPRDGSGIMNAANIKIFTGTFLGPYCRSGITPPTTTITNTISATATTSTSTTTTVIATTTTTTTYTHFSHTFTKTGHKTCSGTYSSEPLTGNIGTFNLGGTKAQILLGTYTKQTPFSPTSFLTFYFTSLSRPSTPVYSWIYTQGNGMLYGNGFGYGNGMGYGNMWVNDLAGSFGDIVT